MAVHYPDILLRLISHFMRFEGVGRRTAERLAFHLLSHWNDHAISEFIEVLSSLRDRLSECPTCFSYSEEAACPFCDEDRSDSPFLCIVAQPRDVYLIESTSIHKGGYFVLGNLLSPLDGRGLSSGRKEALLGIIQKRRIQEVVLALDSSVEGEATALYVRQLLSPYSLTLTKLASGLPIGSQLDFVDRGTLSEAFRGRHHF